MAEDVVIDSYLVVKNAVYVPHLFEVWKRCNKCGAIRPTSEYWHQKRNRDGLNPICKLCQAEYTRGRADINSQRSRDWYANNRERAIEYRRQHYIDHSDEYKARAAIRSIEHADEIRKYERKRYLSRRDEVKRRSSHYSAWARGSIGEWSQEEWDTLCELANHKCMCCGKEETVRDHIVPIADGGDNWITNLQVLCRSCNSSKGNRHSIDYRPEHIKRWAEEQCQKRE